VAANLAGSRSPSVLQVEPPLVIVETSYDHTIPHRYRIDANEEESDENDKRNSIFNEFKASSGKGTKQRNASLGTIPNQTDISLKSASFFSIENRPLKPKIQDPTKPPIANSSILPPLLQSNPAPLV